VHEDAPISFHPHRLPRPKLETQKIKVNVREVAAPVHILAVDDHACRDLCPGVSATLTTIALYDSSLRWLGIGS
jgi:hypothetical protein